MVLHFTVGGKQSLQIIFIIYVFIMHTTCINKHLGFSRILHNRGIEKDLLGMNDVRVCAHTNVCIRAVFQCILQDQNLRV
jgi:hypothetical protein